MGPNLHLASAWIPPSMTRRDECSHAACMAPDLLNPVIAADYASIGRQTLNKEAQRGSQVPREIEAALSTSVGRPVFMTLAA